VLAQVDGLACRDDDQQRPELVASVQLWKTASFNSAEETVEGAQGHILLVVGLSRRTLELLTR
jgi:hypothetical protein